MMAAFADTFYFLALLSPQDRAHRKAVEFSRENERRLLTTAWVLTELADGLAPSRKRDAFRRVLDDLLVNPDHIIVPADEELWHRGIDLYNARVDKQWSLTDCISFVVMKERGIQEALTGDHHFEQAGFTALLK